MGNLLGKITFDKLESSLLAHNQSCSKKASMIENHHPSSAVDGETVIPEPLKTSGSVDRNHRDAFVPDQLMGIISRRVSSPDIKSQNKSSSHTIGPKDSLDGSDISLTDEEYADQLSEFQTELMINIPNRIVKLVYEQIHQGVPKIIAVARVLNAYEEDMNVSISKVRNEAIVHLSDLSDSSRESILDNERQIALSIVEEIAQRLVNGQPETVAVARAMRSFQNISTDVLNVIRCQVISLLSNVSETSLSADLSETSLCHELNRKYFFEDVGKFISRIKESSV